MLAVWLLHAFVLHYWFIGFQSWDGLTHRVPPAVELLAHGEYGFSKFNYWVLQEYKPFVELAYVPFLYVFKLPGVLIAPLVVFPACVATIYLFARELTGEDTGGTFGALAYAAIPLVNQQPFSGYIDFVVNAQLAFVLYAFLRLRSEDGKAALVRLLAGVLAFTWTRQHGVYMLALLFPLLAYPLFLERDGFRLRVAKPRALKLAALGLGLGSVPAVYLQVSKIVRYGNPLYPYQFSFLGFTTSSGVTTKALFLECGLDAYTFPAMLRAFVGGWVWPRTWQVGGFFDSRHLGGGFVLVVAAALLPVFLRTAGRLEKTLVLGLVGVSLIARDFWLPRYAYGVVLSLIIVVARGACSLSSTLSAASASLPAWRQRASAAVFWIAIVVLFAHLLVPDLDLYRIGKGMSVGPRLNASRSASFRPGPDVLEPYPDVHGRFVIIQLNFNGFLLPLYGKDLTNDIVATVPAAELGGGCTNLAPFLAREPEILFIDDYNHTKDCQRECAFGIPNWCQAYRIRPSTPEP